METHVYANDNEICSQAADGKSIAGPDPCLSPQVIPYINTAFATNLANGSATVSICNTPVALRDVSYLDNSVGNEGATVSYGMGVSSHVIKGKAYFTSWSPNVKFEGLNVCRHADAMTHNHG